MKKSQYSLHSIPTPRNRKELWDAVSRVTGKDRALVSRVIKEFEKAMKYVFNNPIGFGNKFTVKFECPEKYGGGGVGFGTFYFFGGNINQTFLKRYRIYLNESYRDESSSSTFYKKRKFWLDHYEYIRKYGTIENDEVIDKLESLFKKHSIEYTPIDKSKLKPLKCCKNDE